MRFPRFGLPGWRRFTVAALAAAGLAAAHVAGADDDPFQMLAERNYVTAASKRPQPVDETPSIVTVITATEIRTHGYRTLGEALQWVRGLYTRYDRNYTYLGVRGIQRPGDYNNKVLLTLDGHTMNSPIYGDAVFGRELGLDMESVQRIEVIRGPGSALYGSDAVLAVINVVTQPARANAPLETGGSLGNLGERRAYTSFASARANRPQFTLTGSWMQVRGADPEALGLQPMLPLATTDLRLDGEASSSLFATLGWRSTKLAVKFNERTKHVPTGAYGTRLGDPSTRTRDGHDFVEISSRFEPVAAVELATRAYWDGSRYWGSYAFGPDSARVTNHDLGYSDLVGTELRLNWRPMAHHVTSFGAEGRWVLRALQSNADIDPFYLYSRSDLHSWFGSLYLQDEVQLPRGARMTAGTRIDGKSGRQGLFSPRLDLRVPLNPVTTWKLLAGTAYRDPVPYELDYDQVGQVQNPGLLPERLNSLETAIERRVGAAQVLLSGYRNWTRDLIEIELLDTLGTFRFFNRGRVASTGVEGEIEWSPRAGMTARGDLGWQESRDQETHDLLTNSPAWNGHLLLTQAPAGSPIRLGLGMRWLGRRTTLRGSRLPSYAMLDGRLAFAPRTPVECGLEVRNLLDVRYSDPGASEHLQDSIPQDGRGLYVTIALRRSSAP